MICFRNMASYIIDQVRKKGVDSSQDIIVAAAQIIKSEIREMTKNTDEYPSNGILEDEKACLE